MRNVIALATGLLLVAAAAACTGGRTMVLAPPSQQVRAASVTVVEEKATVGLPGEVSGKFRDQLERNLFGSVNGAPPAFAKGGDLTLKYRFIQFNEGSRAKRWLAGGIGGYGQGSMTVQARFYDPAGKEISMIQSEGTIGAGIFGGSFDGAVKKCAEEIANYARQNFR